VVIEAANVPAVPHLLIAADADWVIDDVRSALEERSTTFTVCRTGQQVVPAAIERTPDLAVLDLQIGNMGGMAVCMSLHLDESAGRLPHVKVLMLLDREADIHLARRSDAEGWLVRPLDPLRLQLAAETILAGGTYHEGLPSPHSLTPEEAEPEVELEEPAEPSTEAALEASTPPTEAESPRGDEVATG
jgi:CheY-like chemotaxis protein